MPRAQNNRRSVCPKTDLGPLVGRGKRDKEGGGRGGAGEKTEGRGQKAKQDRREKRKGDKKDEGKGERQGGIKEGGKGMVLKRQKKERKGKGGKGAEAALGAGGGKAVHGSSKEPRKNRGIQKGGTAVFLNWGGGKFCPPFKFRLGGFPRPPSWEPNCGQSGEGGGSPELEEV